MARLLMLHIHINSPSFQALNTALWLNSNEKYHCQPEELRAAASTAARLVSSPEPQPLVP